MKKTTKILAVIFFLVMHFKPASSQVTIVELNISQPGVENCIAGVETNILRENISVFPNPADGIFTVSMNNLPLMGNLNITIYTINGQKIYSEKIVLEESSFENKIDLSAYPAGTYLLNISANDKYYNAEIVIK